MDGAAKAQFDPQPHRRCAGLVEVQVAMGEVPRLVQEGWLHKVEAQGE